jgi:hypothetical protein
MRVATGRVIDGKVVIEGLPLEEGSLVTVLARDREETFVLSPDEESELLISIAEADRGDTIAGEELLNSLPRGQDCTTGCRFASRAEPRHRFGAPPSGGSETDFMHRGRCMRNSRRPLPS